MEIEDGRITGRLSGRNCYGPEKVERLEEVLGKLDNYLVYAYGDSKGDRELLAVADHGFFRHFPVQDQR
jgi:phosphoserine phosphatase